MTDPQLVTVAQYFRERERYKQYSAWYEGCAVAHIIHSTADSPQYKLILANGQYRTVDWFTQVSLYQRPNAKEA